MKPMKLNIKSETGKLKRVVIGYTKNFHSCTPEIVNEKQKESYKGNGKPTAQTLRLTIWEI